MGSLDEKVVHVPHRVIVNRSNMAVLGCADHTNAGFAIDRISTRPYGILTTKGSVVALGCSSWPVNSKFSMCCPATPQCTHACQPVGEVAIVVSPTASHCQERHTVSSLLSRPVRRGLYFQLLMCGTDRYMELFLLRPEIDKVITSL